MKKFFALCFIAVIACTALASTGWAGYDASEYQDKPYTNYLTNCYGFVNAVLAKEQNVTLPAYDATMRYYPNNDNYLVGGKLLNSEGYTATTFENIKALFDNAEVGDVVQMYWDTGADYSSQHTVIVSATDKANNKVWFLHSNWWPHFTYPEIVNTEFSYSTIADCCTKAINKSFHDGTYKYGGISLYRFSGSATPTPTPLPEGSVRIDEENFPDEVFRNYVLDWYDTNRDGILSAEEAARVTSMTLALGVKNTKGIEYFTALTVLWCKNCSLTALDVSGCSALTALYCLDNNLTSLDVSKNTALTSLNCQYNQLTELDVSHNTALEMLSCEGNDLTSLDVSKNTALTSLNCSVNQLTALNVSHNFSLKTLRCDNNQLTALDLSKNTALKELDCRKNQLTELDVSNCSQYIIIYRDSGVKIIRNKPNLISSLVDIATNTPVSVFRLHSNVLDATAQLIDAVSQSGIITDTGTKETLHKVARGLQIISSIYSGNFLTRFFTDKVIPAILKSSGGDDTEKFQLSESLSLNVTPAVFKTSEGTVKITLASSRDLSHDVYCTIVSDDSGRFFKVPASDSSRRLFTAEFNAGEFFASMDAGIIELMCVSCISDDEGICGMLMSNTASVDWLMNDTTPPEILTETLTNAITNQAYSLQLTASGGTPITWTRKGNFPKGLTLSESGLISGTPTKAGKYTFTVTASNSYGESSKKFTIQVIDPVSITTASLRAGTIGKSYNVTMKAKGSKVITWSAEGLPNGLTINAKGKISEKPTAYGDFSVKITATNPAGSVTKSLQLTVKAIEPKLAGSLARPTLNEAYSSGLKVTGSTPIIWTLTGNLPEGLTFDTSTGIISGTPTSYAKSGYKITITASNDAGKKSKKITLKVNAKAPRITTSKLPEATVNQSYSFALTATGSTPITFTADNLPEGLTLSNGVISGKPTEAAKSFRIVIYAENPVKTVKKSFTLKINDDDSNTQFPAVKFSDVTPNVMLTDEILPESISGGYVFSLGEVSCDESGMYDFELEFPDYVNEGSELVYAANSESPSDDDDIAEFFDENGNEIAAVPASRKIIISVWLNEGVTYKPVVIVKK